MTWVTTALVKGDHGAVKIQVLTPEEPGAYATAEIKTSATHCYYKQFKKYGPYPEVTSERRN